MTSKSRMAGVGFSTKMAESDLDKHVVFLTCEEFDNAFDVQEKKFKNGFKEVFQKFTLPCTFLVKRRRITSSIIEIHGYCSTKDCKIFIMKHDLMNDRNNDSAGHLFVIYESPGFHLGECSNAQRYCEE
jgi:hypothetical protein